jgi:hypothetical protein
MRYPFAYALDETQQIAKSYGAIRTPHVFLLSNSSNGWKVYYVGAIDDNFEEPEKVTKRYAEDAMNALLQNRTPELTYTKAIGCGIKWKK